MEKVIYALWRAPGQDMNGFNARLRKEIGPELAKHAKAVRLNIQDEHVEGGNSPRLNSRRPQMDAVIQVWTDSGNDLFRRPLDEVIAGAGGTFAAWLVSESTAIENTLHPPRPGQRTEGFSQMVFLGLPPRLTWETWLHNWKNYQTPVAIETQSNFEYIQNLVVTPLTEGAPDYVAIVEECFPAEAFHDVAAYFDAKDSPAKLEENQTRMADTCALFMDFDRVECIPTSQYEIKSLD